jgi:hypothetical protein
VHSTENLVQVNDGDRMDPIERVESVAPVMGNATLDQIGLIDFSEHLTGNSRLYRAREPKRLERRPCYLVLHPSLESLTRCRSQGEQRSRSSVDHTAP